ncbi:hypothetical protein [Altererythrobacter sp. Z27]|uniref:hypothetical protein n=1 Tax=Altererythrobacter sp. Z27 TaxID=3461147 RepID=UPI004044AEA5
MTSNCTEYAALYRRFEGLGRNDKKAILELLDDDERTAFEAAVASEKLERADEAKRLRALDRQYLAYSAWLGDLIENSDKNDNIDLTRLAKNTLVAEHRAGVELLQVPEPMGWRLLLTSLQQLLLPAESSPR